MIIIVRRPGILVYLTSLLLTVPPSDLNHYNPRHQENSCHRPLNNLRIVSVPKVIDLVLDGVEKDTDIEELFQARSKVNDRLLQGRDEAFDDHILKPGCCIHTTVPTVADDGAEKVIETDHPITEPSEPGQWTKEFGETNEECEEMDEDDTKGSDWNIDKKR